MCYYAAMTKFPNGKRFSFTIFDDTDAGTVANLSPVYDLLAGLGIYTTKSVWPLACQPEGNFPGQTLQDEQYVLWLQSLSKQGFEIALHGATNFASDKEAWQLAFKCFEDKLGFRPRSHCNHSSNRDNIYWGDARFSGKLIRFIYNLATRFRRKGFFQGHVEGSEYFWGDLCKKHISYVRNFVYNEINLDKINPSMPYQDPSKPWVNRWFSSAEGGDLQKFCKMLSEENQDRLEAEGGVCIIYTHFAKGFVENGVLDTNFESLMRRLASKAGWFVPVSVLLDFLAQERGGKQIPQAELTCMERGWLLSKLFKGTA